MLQNCGFTNEPFDDNDDDDNYADDDSDDDDDILSILAIPLQQYCLRLTILNKGKWQKCAPTCVASQLSWQSVVPASQRSWVRIPLESLELSQVAC